MNNYLESMMSIKIIIFFRSNDFDAITLILVVKGTMAATEMDEYIVWLLGWLKEGVSEIGDSIL